MKLGIGLLSDPRGSIHAPSCALLVLLTAIPCARAATPDPTPLLTFAATAQLPPEFDNSAEHLMRQRLSRATADIAKEPPPQINCATTLGAKRFATLYDELGAAYANLNEDERAAEAFAKAIGCSPRAGFLHTELATSLLNLGRYDESRLEARRQLAPNQNNFASHGLLVQLDVIQNRWTEAVADARQAATEAPDDNQAAYWQCFLWLAQKNLGLARPTLVVRRAADNWPQSILESLEGRLSEANLVDDLKAEQDGRRRREYLSEALFYTGERHLADHRPDVARRYFTATVALHVQYFIEHHLALAELEKLRAAGP